MDRYTASREVIRDWLNEHGFFPAVIKGTTDDSWYDRPDAIEFVGRETSDIEQIGWDEFFDWMEYHNLALRYSDESIHSLGGFDFVDRNRVERELSPDLDGLDSGDPEVLYENSVSDAE